MAVADVLVELVFFYGLAQVVEYRVAVGDRLARPGFEAVAKGIEVAVGADAGVGVLTPGATESVLVFQHHKGFARALFQQMMGRADAGDTGADNQHIEVFRGGRRQGSNRGHGCTSQVVQCQVHSVVPAAP